MLNCQKADNGPINFFLHFCSSSKYAPLTLLDPYHIGTSAYGKFLKFTTMDDPFESTLKKQKSFKISPKWRNFAKTGHTGWFFAKTITFNNSIPRVFMTPRKSSFVGHIFVVENFLKQVFIFSSFPSQIEIFAAFACCIRKVELNFFLWKKKLSNVAQNILHENLQDINSSLSYKGPTPRFTEWCVDQTKNSCWH